MQRNFGTKLTFSIAFHPQADGQSERTIYILENMLRACILDFKESWVKYLSLVKFAYINGHQESIDAVPYEILYRHKCRSLLYWDEVGEKKILDPNLI